MALVLTPSTIQTADYPLAQTPVLGGEIDVYLTTKASRLLGTVVFTADGTGGTNGFEWRFKNLPTTGGGNPGPIVAVALESGVMQGGLSGSAKTIAYAGMSATFTPVGWTSNLSFDFPSGRAVEFDAATYVAPTSSSVPTVTSGMKQGSKFALIELPKLTDFVLAGCTNDRRIKFPARGTKNIPCGMYEAEWTTPGRVRVGELEITGLKQSIDDGLGRFIGLQCQAMLVQNRGGRLITERSFLLDFTPESDQNYPEGESEATVTARGQFSKIAVLPAP